jgi:hypothetical protein
MLARYPDDGPDLVVPRQPAPARPGRIADRLADFYFHPDHAAGPPGRRRPPNSTATSAAHHRGAQPST